ncbi:MAG: right-handed parallel beta-helix repeat-containing protein [Candidatus Coatesbacteria bacterium]|nr:right-handed parallel beta-helix repeat-containing protein [Candidatus Coatesbacteria bacterium]
MAGRHLRWCVLIFSLSLCAGGVLAQDTIVVPDDYPTIQQAIDAASAGDTVFVAGSETSYQGNVELRDGIVLEGEGARYTTIQGDNYYHAVVMANDTTIRGFTIMGNPSCVYSEARNVVIEENALLGHYYGIQVEAGSIDIVNNDVKGAPPFFAVYCANCDVTIANCDILGAYAGIKLEDSQVSVCRSIIRGTDNGVSVESCTGSIFNCYVLDNRFDAVELRDADGFIVANNVVYGKGHSLLRGVLCYDAAPIIANNIISSCRFGVMTGPDAAPLILYNDVYGCPDGNYVDFNEDVVVPSPGLGELSADPLFVGPGDIDYSLADDSPCKDVGYTTDSFRDLDGSATDMGAHGGPYAGWVGQGQPPYIRVTANRDVVGAADGDPFIVSVAYTNRTEETVEVDRYVAVMADFGLFYLPWLSAEPMAKRMFVEPTRAEIMEEILSIEDTLVMPVGEYTFYAAFARPGTFDFYSGITTYSVVRVNKPVAKFTVTPSEGRVGDIFHFDASESYDIEDPLVVLKTQWDWENDGTWDQDWRFNKTADHSYTTPGTKTIVLEVRDTEGYIGSTAKQVTVTE